MIINDNKCISAISRVDFFSFTKMGEQKYLPRFSLRTSTVVANPACSYAIAVIRQNRLTLTPVRAVNQCLRGTDGSESVAPPKGFQQEIHVA